jgi:NADH-quinone oxidoreductase subunit M
MLIALIYLYYKSGGSFDILTWHKLPLPSTAQTLLFFAFFLAFAVKVPMWPVHTWLPDAHVEAPTGGSVVLAAIMLKLGAYGFLRFSLPIAPDASQQWAWFIAAISLIAVVYIGLVALVQQDMKKLVAYSSIAHMGFVTFGFFIFNELGMSGGIVQMISHGFVSGCDVPVHRRALRPRALARDRGLRRGHEHDAEVRRIRVLFAMANCGLPGTAGFVGEWMVILGAGEVQLLACRDRRHRADLGRRVHAVDGQARVLRRRRERARQGTHRHHTREFAMLAVLAIAVLWMGLYPKPFTDVMQVSVAELLKHVAVSKLGG